MILNRKVFYGRVRLSPFPRSLSGSQVDGMETILDAVPNGMPVEHVAYCLATTKWETAHTMQPIEEYGRGAGHSYGQPDPVTGKTYYGRGLVQLTWKANYQKAQDELSQPFVANPALALNKALAARIMFRGMAEGWFTGKRLSDYLGPGRSDPVGARRIINGTDHAADIAVIYQAFKVALTAAVEAPSVVAVAPIIVAPPMPEPAVVAAQTAPMPALPPAPPSSAPYGWWSWLRSLFG